MGAAGHTWHSGSTKASADETEVKFLLHGDNELFLSYEYAGQLYPARAFIARKGLDIS